MIPAPTVLNLHRRLTAAARATAAMALAAIACVALGACAAGGDHTPPRSALPFVRGASVALDARVCNRGANVYCASELVVDDPLYRSSAAFLLAERRFLHRRGWKRIDAAVGTEYGLDSPADTLRVELATAWADLSAVDYGWIKRKHAVALALSHALIARTSTLSVLLQYGAGEGST